VAQSPPYLHPFACFICRRSFRRPDAGRDEAPCPACGTRAIRLNRKFKPPRRGDTAQWTKVEALVKLGFRFDSLYDADGASVRYPSTARGIAAFLNKLARIAEERVERQSRLKVERGLKRRVRNARRMKKR
jgi:hypothetical protein